MKIAAETWMDVLGHKRFGLHLFALPLSGTSGRTRNQLRW